MKPGAQVPQSQPKTFNHAAELTCQGRALTFPGNPTPCPLSAGEQQTQMGAGQGELCHRDEGWGEWQGEGGWRQGWNRERVCEEDGERDWVMRNRIGSERGGQEGGRFNVKVENHQRQEGGVENGTGGHET